MKYLVEYVTLLADILIVDGGPIDDISILEQRQWFIAVLQRWPDNVG